MTANTNIVTFAVGGQEYLVDLYDIDGVEWRDAKRASGYPSQRALIEAALGPSDFDAVAALVWIVTRREDPSATYIDTLRRFSYGALAGEDVQSTSLLD